jgi:putative endonuclease
MTNKYNTVLYTGVTNNLEKRVYEHKQKLDFKSFTSRYRIDKLVYFEQTSDVESAIAREKQIKAGPRNKKNQLIKRQNKEWKDLSKEWT